MSKKTSQIKSPPQKTVTRAPEPTESLGGGVVFRSPTERLTSEDLKKLPKPIRECPLRWIYGSQLMAYTNLSKGELMDLIGEGKIKAFYESDGWMCYPNFYYTPLEDHQFGLVDVFELENQGYFNLVDDPYFRHCTELYQAWKEGSDNKQSLKEGDEPLPSIEKGLRPVQKHKKKCREVAQMLWKENSKITIADMCYKDDINKVFDGKTYSDKTIRNWIKDLCPDRSPGRRSRNKSA